MKSSRTKTTQKKKKVNWREWLVTAIAALSLTSTLIWIVYAASTQPKAGHHHAELPTPGTIIDHDKVCMASNVYLETAQALVEIRGKRYHSCSNICTGKLLADSSARFATDPASKKIVNKADAFITMNPDSIGTLLYFESRSNLMDYISKQ